MSVAFTFDVETTGPVFDGRLAAALEKAERLSEEAVGVAGVNRIKQRMGTNFKNPSGFYESQVQTDRAIEHLEVTDGGVVYGPWLEGVDSRNVSSRFKGYSLWRRTRKELQPMAGKIAEPIVKRVVESVTQ